jgi:hypothetical protein
MTVNYCNMTVKYHDILTLEIIGFLTTVIYHEKLRNSFITLVPGLARVHQVPPTWVGSLPYAQTLD